MVLLGGAGLDIVFGDAFLGLVNVGGLVLCWVFCSTIFK